MHEKSINDSYIIRIYDQDLCGDWVDRGGYETPNNYISSEELFQDLKDNGLEIVKFTFSSFGACYFLEVKGLYKGNIKYQKLKTNSVDFWN